MYKLFMPNEVKRTLARLPVDDARNLIAVLEDLRRRPIEDLRDSRFGDYRIVYAIDDDARTIELRALLKKRSRS